MLLAPGLAHLSSPVSLAGLGNIAIAGMAGVAGCFYSKESGTGAARVAGTQGGLHQGGSALGGTQPAPELNRTGCDVTRALQLSEQLLQLQRLIRGRPPP